MALTRLPRASFSPSFPLHLPYDSPRLSEEVSTDSSPGFNSIDLEAVENDTLTPANTPTTNNSLGLQIVNNDESYVIIIQMGTPPRDFKMLVDSGSADLWVGGEGCKSVTGGDCVSFTSHLFSPDINLFTITML